MKSDQKLENVFGKGFCPLLENQRTQHNIQTCQQISFEIKKNMQFSLRTDESMKKPSTPVLRRESVHVLYSIIFSVQRCVYTHAEPRVAGATHLARAAKGRTRPKVRL